MVDTFHSHYFGFLRREVDIERQTLDGGTSISGETDRTSIDGGGRVFADFGDGSLMDREKVLAWRAFSAIVEEGVTPVIVTFCDLRHQPGPARALPATHSDGTPFGDGAPYLGLDGLLGAVDGAPALRATQLTFTGDLTRFPLLGGEWFSIEHPGKGWRAYRVRKVLAQTTAGATVEFRPPLREAVADGSTVDFRNPRCLMVADGRPGTALFYGRLTEAAIRFVEAP